MHLTSFIPAVALFFISAVNAGQDDALSAHHLVARSSHLALRQLGGNFGSCDSKCSPVQTKLTSCGTNVSCLCGSSMSSPFHDCAECAYTLTTDATTKSQLISYYNQYVAACKDAGSPVQGDTTIGDGSSSSSSSSSTKANAAATLSSRLPVALGLPVAAVAVSAFFL